jgi:radical SAM superfamily enzyme YgiQ (UPF0313 family)
MFDYMEWYKPTWVVFNPISSTVSHDMITAHYAKSLGAKTVAISPHTKVFKEECLERYPSLDFAIDYKKGGHEPEYNLRELIKGQKAEGTRFEDLPPARQDLLPISRYSLPFIGERYTFVVTSRGCPWSCIYCRQNVMNENKVRFRPVETVISEIAMYGLRNISLHADTSTMNKKWMMDFCERLINLRKAWKHKVKWICNSRVDTVDLEMMKKMKEAGCWMIVFGCESGNNRVLKMNKKEATVEQAKKAVKEAKEAGLSVWGYFMLGMYGDNRDSMDDTIRLACSEPFDIVNFAIAAPYPGTEWGEIANREGWLVDDRWESYDQNYSAQVEQPECPTELVKLYQRRAYRKWFGSWRGIRFIAKGFRPRYLSYFIKTAWAHLKI